MQKQRSKEIIGSTAKHFKGAGEIWSLFSGSWQDFGHCFQGARGALTPSLRRTSASRSLFTEKTLLCGSYLILALLAVKGRARKYKSAKLNKELNRG